MDTLEKRLNYFPKCLYHSFDKPIELVSSKNQYYFDKNNKQYLDLYNNVCHIGHSNDKIQEIIEKEYSLININTRYLNPNLTNYAEHLNKYLPKSKKYKMLFVNSGSEANDLALRITLLYNELKQKDELSKSFEKHLLSMEYSYHGTTYLCDKVSHLYSTGVKKLENGINYKDGVMFIRRNNKMDILNYMKNASGFIVENIQGVGGNYDLDGDFLKFAFQKAKEHDVITICDEVQTGFGRTGYNFWAFEYFGLEPDIITCGKPIANGYPMGAIIIREDLAELLGNFYFNTYGGNSVACRVAKSVLEQLEEMELIKHSKEVGNYLKEKLEVIQGVISVSGRGLYLGIKMNNSYNTKNIVEKLKEFNIIVGLGSEGIIRIKPPLVVNKENINHFLNIFREIMININKI